MELGKTEIKINIEDFSFISENIVKLRCEKQIHNKCQLLLSLCEIEEILDKLSSYFIKNGLYKNDEPNEIGLYIESLINIFSEKLYEM